MTTMLEHMVRTRLEELAARHDAAVRGLTMEGFMSREHEVLVHAHHDEDHIVTVCGIGEGYRSAAVQNLAQMGLLKKDARPHASPFHDWYRLTREGAKLARRLAKAEEA